jgi:dolichol-phosphate mannosyltransferase
VIKRMIKYGNRTMGSLAGLPIVGKAFAGDEHQVLRRLVKFLLVGSSGIIVTMTALYLLHGVLGLPLLPATALAVEIAIINNFIFNNLWTFRAGALRLGRFVRFNSVAFVGLVLTTVLTALFVDQLGLHYLIANFFAIGAATSWNFVANSIWTWS